MSQIVLASDTLLASPATGTLEYNGQFYGTDSNSARAQMQRITQSTSQASTSGTSISFTSIPSWVKKITIMFQGVSTNGTNALQVQVGAGSISTSGYLSSGSNCGNATTPAVAAFTTGFGLMSSTAAAGIHHGTVWLTNLSGNNWVQSGMLARSDSAVNLWSGGSIALGGVLDQLRIIGSATGSPSDTFDAGSINIIYEG